MIATLTPVSLEHYCILSLILFSVGLFGFFRGRNSILHLLMALELMLLAVNINLVAFSSFNHDLIGQLFTLFILTVAAAEAAIGLAILVVYHRHRDSIDVMDLTEMKG